MNNDNSLGVNLDNNSDVHGDSTGNSSLVQDSVIADTPSVVVPSVDNNDVSNEQQIVENVESNNPDTDNSVNEVQEVDTINDNGIMADSNNDLEQSDEQIDKDIEILSVKKYLGYLFLFMIPIVGQILLVMKAFNKKNKAVGNFAKALLIFVVVVGVVSGILFVTVFSFVFSTSKKMVCTSNEGDITIHYNNESLISYNSVGISFDFDAQKSLAGQIGISAYLDDFSEWFENSTSGSCKK